MKYNAEKINLQSKLFRALSDPTRLKIVYHLIDECSNVSCLINKINIKQSTLSQHLKHLKDCGIVCVKKQGRQVFYSICDKKIVNILKDMDSIVKIIYKKIISCINT